MKNAESLDRAAAARSGPPILYWLANRRRWPGSRGRQNHCQRQPGLPAADARQGQEPAGPSPQPPGSGSVKPLVLATILAGLPVIPV